jgi:hypothetical protein
MELELQKLQSKAGLHSFLGEFKNLEKAVAVP